MGLDNGFILHSKENPGVSIYMATFRNFYELDGWITSNCSRVDEDISSYLVSEEQLRNLLSEIEPIAKVFQGWMIAVLHITRTIFIQTILKCNFTTVHFVQWGLEHRLWFLKF